MRIQNIELADLLSKKSALVDEARGISKKIDKLETERRKIGLQVQKIKDQVIPMVKELTKDIGEFEEVSTVDLKDGEIEILTVDVVENFKRDYLEAKANQNKEEAK